VRTPGAVGNLALGGCVPSSFTLVIDTTMSNQAQPKRASGTAQRLMPARLLLGLAIIAAIIYFVDHMPLKIVILSFVLTVLIIFLVRVWQRRSGILK